MELKNLESTPCVWEPINIPGSNLSKFTQQIEEEFHVKIDNYWDLHRWSIENLTDFWTKVWDFTDIIYSKHFETVIEENVLMSNFPKWFVGARLNFAENVLRYKDDHPAMIGINKNLEKRTISYAKLFHEVELYAAAFRKQGLKNGDKIVCYMHQREELIFAFLAAMSIGAIWIPAHVTLRAKVILAQIKQVRPSFLITEDKYFMDNKEIDLFPELVQISRELPSLEKVIIIPFEHNVIEKDISFIPNSCYINKFLDSGCNIDGLVPDIIYEQLPVSHPSFINFTSGTTDTPKALVHGLGGIIEAMRDQKIMFSTRRNNVYLQAIPTGWTIWSIITVFYFISGSTMVFLDDIPLITKSTKLWDVIDDNNVNLLLVTPSLLDELEIRQCLPTDKHSLKSLQSIGSGGSSLRPQNYDFVHSKIKPGIFLASFYGCSEFMASLTTAVPSLPLHKGELSCPALGVDMQCLDEFGDPVFGKQGNLVLSKPIPSLTLGLYNDANGSTFKDKYFSMFPEKFFLGDSAVINPFTKGIIILGRSDAVLNPFGCRFGPIEIYNIVNVIPEIEDSICVSQYSKSRKERVVLYLKMKKSYTFDEELLLKVRRKIKRELKEECVPAVILQTAEIPYNFSGKKMEILVKKIINNMPYSTDNVLNVKSLQNFLNVPTYED